MMVLEITKTVQYNERNNTIKGGVWRGNTLNVENAVEPREVAAVGLLVP